MNTVALESSNIVETYRSKTRESAALSEDAAAQFPSGITPVSYTHLTLPTNREV